MSNPKLYRLTSLVKRARSLLDGTIKDNIFYLHVPKCGGTSIHQAIRERYETLSGTNFQCMFRLDPRASTATANLINDLNFPFDTSDDYHILKLRESLLLYYMGRRNMKYISGHFAFSKSSYSNFGDKYKFITVLRDPVKRWISLYFFNRYKKDDHCKIESDIKSFLDSEYARSQGYEYVKFLGGLNRERDYTSQSAIDRTKANLHKLSIVGCLEYPGIFINQFESNFGIRLKIGEKNRNPKQEPFRKSIITEEIENKIREICKPDLEIYQYAMENFVRA